MRRCLLVLLCACSGPSTVSDPDAAGTPDAPPTVEAAPLEVHALGVQGFLLRRGRDVVMTAPLFTRQTWLDVTFNVPLVADTQMIDAKLAGAPLADLRAIVSGHAHYDHFMDVPRVLETAPHAIAYTNLSGRHMLAALAPDRPTCTNAPQSPTIARERVVALDDPLASYVDYTNCPDLRPWGAPLEGQWLYVPDSNVRLMAFCSKHPAQIGPYHFGAGSVDVDQCQLPVAASGWLEGRTFAIVIDFLDAQREPTFRVFYQDAPTNQPVGHVTPPVLAGKAVDLALLCVGSADSVTDHPTQIIANIAPRFALSGHWEDFFQSLDSPPRPIPLLDLAKYVQRAEAALPGSPATPLVVDGAPVAGRHALVQPGSRFVVPLAP